MTLNASKTKVIVFGAGKGDTTDLQMDHEAIEEVMRFKYLAVVLDEELEFTLQVDYVVGKEKTRWLRYLDFLTVERVFLCNWELVFTMRLVSLHFEYAEPVWAALCRKDLVRLAQVQVQCLRSMVWYSSV